MEVFGHQAAKAYRVADCETGAKLSAGLDPLYVNATAANWTHGYYSIFQVDADLHGYDAGALLADIRYAANAAYALSSGGINWYPWPTCGFA